MKYFLILGLLFFQAVCVVGQVPDNDPTWDSKYSELFSFNSAGNFPWANQKNYLTSSSIGWHLGWKSDQQWLDAYAEKGEFAIYETTDGNNHELSFGTLKIYLKKDSLNPYNVFFDSLWVDSNGNPVTDPSTGQQGISQVTRSYKYTSGKLHMTIAKSMFLDTDYGYYEMAFKIPDDEAKTKGIQTNFWSFGADVNPTNPDDITYCEIDYFEIEGFGKWHTHNFHLEYKWENDAGIGYTSENITQFDAIANIGLQKEDFDYFDIDDVHTANPAGFDTIGCAVEPNKISFYFNSKFIKSIERNDNARVDDISLMQMELNSLIYTGFWDNKSLLNHLPNNQTVFPNVFEIDHIKFWKLKCPDGGVFQVITPDNFNISSPPNEIVGTATLGTDLGGMPNEILNGSSYTLHSEGEIRLEDGFFVDDLSFFHATNSECE